MMLNRITVCLVLALCVAFAPAPLPKRKLPTYPCNWYVGDWSDYAKDPVCVYFYSNGRYYEVWRGHHYEGSWERCENCVSVRCAHIRGGKEYQLRYERCGDLIILREYNVQLTRSFGGGL